MEEYMKVNCAVDSDQLPSLHWKGYPPIAISDLVICSIFFLLQFRGELEIAEV